MLRIFRHYIPKSLVVLGTGEAVLLFCSVYVGVTFGLTEFNPTAKLLVGQLWPKAAAYTVAMMLALAGMGLYHRYLRDDLRGILFRTGLALLFGLLFLYPVIKLKPSVSIGTPALTIAFLASALSILIFRGLLFHYRHNDIFRRRVLILGAGAVASQVEELRRRVDRQDMTLVGFVPATGEQERVTASKIVRMDGNLLDLAQELGVDEIVVALDDEVRDFPVNQILDCKMRGIRIIDLVTFFELQTGKIKLDALSPGDLIFSEGFIQAVVRSYVHRLFDIVVSVAVLAVVWPLMLATAVAILIESRGDGPILYRQIRTGRDARRFELLKFRSMQVDAEAQGEAQWAQAQDSRVTRVGQVIRKLRIDELPQLLNVLKGEMSFVGPRPERPEFVARLSKIIPYYDLRHRVNPGITGWAQICYPYGSSERDAKEKLQFDLYYIKNYSLFLDLMILIQTVQAILWGKGAR